MILLYHLVFPDSTPKDAWNAGLVLRLKDFKRQCLWVKRNFCFVSLKDYLEGVQQDPKFSRTHFALTFDDGYAQVFDLVSPFLLSENISATFFVATSHLEDNELLWFVYFNALCSEKIYPSLEIEGQTYLLTTDRSSLVAWQKLIALARQSEKPIAFACQFAKKYPLPKAVYQKYLGFSKDQIAFIGQNKILGLGAHTHTHPYLDQLSLEDQFSQIQHNKELLEAISGESVPFFAYTGGIYNADSIAVVKQLGFKAAFVITPRNLGTDWHFEVPRIDIYSKSLVKFLAKTLILNQFRKQFINYVR